MSGSVLGGLAGVGRHVVVTSGWPGYCCYDWLASLAPWAEATASWLLAIPSALHSPGFGTWVWDL